MIQAIPAADAPKAVSPGIGFLKVRIACRQEFLPKINMFVEFQRDQRFHDTELEPLPILSGLEHTPDTLRLSRRRESCDRFTLRPVGRLGSLVGVLNGGKKDTIDLDRGRVEIRKESEITSKALDSAFDALRKRLAEEIQFSHDERHGGLMSAKMNHGVALHSRIRICWDTNSPQ